MSSLILGNRGVVEQPKKYSGGPNKPDQVIRSWKGPKERIVEMIQQVKAMGFEWSLEESGGTAVVSVTTLGATIIGGQEPGAEVPVDTWELVPGAVEKDILESDCAAVNALTDADKRLMRSIMNNETVASASFSSGAQSAGAAELASAILSGLRVKRIFAPTLTRNRSVSNSYAVIEAETFTERIWSTATLRANEAIPSTFLVSLNKAPYTNAHPNGGAYYVYGWFKHPPTQRASANSRTTLDQKWEFGLYPKVVYGALL